MTNSKAGEYKLNWYFPVTEGKADKPVVETLKLIMQNSLVSGEPVTCHLTGDNAIFQTTGDSTEHLSSDNKSWTNTTGALGRIYPIIKPLNNIDSEVIINAHITNYPDIQAPPLTLKLTSSITVESVVLTPKTAQQLVNGSQEFTATICGTNNKPYSGATVTFNVDKDATLSVASGVTDKKGEVKTTVAGHQPGTVTLTATAGGKFDNGTVEFKAYKITISSSPDKLYFGQRGMIEGYITGIVTAPMTLNVTLSQGVDGPLTVDTDDQGKFNFTVKSTSSGRPPGNGPHSPRPAFEGEISVSYSEASASCQILFVLL